MGLAVNAGVVAIWVVSRTTGLPFGPEPGTPEAIGVPDVTATGFELVIAAILVVRLVPSGAARLRRHSMTVADAALAAVLALVAVALVTAYAATSIAFGGDPDHADGAARAPASIARSS